MKKKDGKKVNRIGTTEITRQQQQQQNIYREK